MESAPHSHPPYKVTHGVKVLKGPWQKITLEPYTDGDQRHWPASNYRTSSDTVYNMRLARAWAEKLNVAEPDFNYYLDDLPKGYATFEIDQAGGGQTYKRLFGHPSGTFFDSIARFQEHFLWLMGGMVGNCVCVLCSKRSGRPFVPRGPQKRREVTEVSPPRRRREQEMRDDLGNDTTRSNSTSGLATGREKRGRPAGPLYAVDEEGAKDVYKERIENLYKAKESRNGIEDEIREEESPDYMAEHDSLTAYLTRIEQQHSFVPRLGELVLWCNYFPDEQYLLKDTSTNEYKFYSFRQECFHGFPDWRAGVVTAVPISAAIDGPVDFQDILDDVPKRTSLNISGFRVETIPDPNSFDKSLSKQYRYLPMRSIRPLSHWQQILHGFPKKHLHKSIYYALTCMTSLSLVNRFKFTGQWPNGSIHCRGLYIGSELITVGDAVRINQPPDKFSASIGKSPSSKALIPDLLVVSSIRLNLHNVEPEHTTCSSPLLSTHSTITLIGSAYTLHRNRDYRTSDDSMDSDSDPIDTETAKSIFRPMGTKDYGAWYPLHQPNSRYEVSHDQVLGRLYESIATQMWTGSSQSKSKSNVMSPPVPPSLTFDLAGVTAGREYATLTDERIPASDTERILWHLTDTRALGLAIGTANGLEVGPYDHTRTKRMLISWRAALRVAQRDNPSLADINAMGLPTAKCRRPGGKEVYPDEEEEYEEHRSRADGMVSWSEVNRMANEDRNDSGTRVMKKKGRKPGSRVIDGKVVYAEQLVDYGIGTEDSSGRMRGIRGPPKAAAGTHSSPNKHGRYVSSMQQAAREDTDSDDLGEEGLLAKYQVMERAASGTQYDGSAEEDEVGENEEGENEDENGEDEDDEDDGEEDGEEENEQDEDGDTSMGVPPRPSAYEPSTSTKNKDKDKAIATAEANPALKKHQIMSSIESPDVLAPTERSDESESESESEQDVSSWFGKPGLDLPARDSTEESEDGNYQDDDGEDDYERRFSKVKIMKVGEVKRERERVKEKKEVEEKAGPMMVDKWKDKDAEKEDEKEKDRMSIMAEREREWRVHGKERRAERRLEAERKQRVDSERKREKAKRGATSKRKDRDTPKKPEVGKNSKG